MNKDVILVLINLPLITIGILDAVSSYKTRRISKRRAIMQVCLWLSLGVFLILLEPAYNALIRYNLTNSPPLSIFDIGLLTMVLFCLFLIKKANEKIWLLNRKISRLHENIVISEERHRSTAKKK